MSTPNERLAGSLRFDWRRMIACVATSALCVVAFANCNGESSVQPASSQASDAAVGGDARPAPAQVQKQKTKKVGHWVCSQCGRQIESIIRPTGRCPSRNNAPHAWVLKGESVEPDTGQKETIWQCGKCFTVLTMPGGAPPTGIRCPAEKNAHHRFEKIAEK